MKYKNFHQTNMLCYAIFLCYVDGGFSSVSTLQHTMLITSRQIVNLSIIKHSLSFLCKILLTQGVSVSLRERVFRKKLICQNVNQLWISSFIFVETIRCIHNNFIFNNKLRTYSSYLIITWEVRYSTLHPVHLCVWFYPLQPIPLIQLQIECSSIFY